MKTAMKVGGILFFTSVLSGCVTTQAYQSAPTTCLQKANAACIAAMQEGYDSGIIVYLPREAHGVYHAIIWVDHRKDGKSNIRYYDPTRKIYLPGISGPVTWVSRGPSLAWFAAEKPEAPEIWAMVAAK